MNSKIKKYWLDFCQKSNINVKTPVDAFVFGATDEEANDLAQLVKERVKTATTSSLKSYEFYDEAIPKIGDYSIVLNASQEPVCIIKDIEVKVVPYYKIFPAYAFLEGEGDRSYAYWKKAHDEFFEREFKEEFHEKFDDHELMVCEIFEKVD